jgi:hypothetical protein
MAIEVTKNTKRQVVYEDEQTTTIWKYDSFVSTFGPVEVEIRYKKGYEWSDPSKKKTLGELAKESKKRVVRKSKVS